MKESTFAFLFDLKPEELASLCDGTVPEQIKKDAKTIQRAATNQCVAGGSTYTNRKR